MLEREEIHKLEIDGKSYPYICDMCVIERLQNEFGDLIEYENGIRGVKPYYASAGEVIKIKSEDGEVSEYIADEGERIPALDQSIIPNVKMICRSLRFMLEEGAEVNGGDADDIPTETDLKRQTDYSVIDLALIAYKEWMRNFFTKRKTETKTDTKKRSTRAKA